MPACYAHYRFGREMLARLPGKARTAVEKFRGLYDLGTHGPDIFFFYRPTLKTPLGALGKKYHFHSGKPLFACGARRLRLKPDARTEAYLYGLLTHYALDSVCHPYVYQAQKEGLAGHIEMETEFDRLLLEKDGLLTPQPHFPTAHMKLGREESDAIAAFYPGATPRQLREAAVSMGFFTRQCLCREGVKHDLLQKALGSRFSQFLMTPGKNPRCEATNEKLLVLYGKSQHRFDTLWDGLQEHLHTGKPLGTEFVPAFDIL